MNDTLNIKVILGSNREARQGAKVAEWVTNVATLRPELTVELVDLAEENLPTVLAALPPAVRGEGQYPSEQVAAWGKKISDADGYVFVVAEYNHGYTAVLKNAIDHLYTEWAKKPVAYVGYSMSPDGASRAIEQLIPVTAHLDMAQAMPSTRIGGVVNFDAKASMSDYNFKQLNGTLDSLVWWAKTLKATRSAKQLATV